MTPDNRQSIPFLKRNFARALHSLTSTFASPQENGTVRDENDGDPPRKRRRVSSPTLTSIDHLLASPRASEQSSALRIEVLKCCHVDTRAAREGFASLLSSNVTSQAICRITISDSSYGRSRVLYCEGQPCEVVTFRNSSSPYHVSRIHLPRPFYVSRNSLLVNRMDDATLGLSDAYNVSVELESADSSTWPPLEADDLGVTTDFDSSPFPNHWVLTSEFDQVYGRLKSRVFMNTGMGRETTAQETNYEMDIDLRWDSGLKASNANSGDAKTVISTSFESELRAQVNGHIHEFKGAHSIIDHDDEENEELRTARSLRNRGIDKNYNLKALSDKAHGTQRKRRAKDASKSIGISQVRYHLPPDQPLCLDGFRCVACGLLHQSLSHLQLHLQSQHPDHEYKLETTALGPQFLVSFRSTPSSVTSQVIDIGLPVRQFNLDSFIRTDQSWFSSRIGPDDSAEEYFPPADAAPEPVVKTVPKPTRGQKTQPQPVPIPVPTVVDVVEPPQRRKVVIPKSTQEFYHPVSKQALKQGDEFMAPLAEESWFHHKHRESLNENAGLSANSLEYIKEFDGVMRNHNIAARAYFPRAWLDFVKQKASWLLEARHRMIEFAMHESYLLAMDLLTDGHLQQAMEYIEEERKKLPEPGRITQEDKEQPAEEAPTPSKAPPNLPLSTRKSSSGCGSCGLPVLGCSRLFVCSEKKCRRRLYHAECVDNQDSLRPKASWVCSKCRGAKAS